MDETGYSKVAIVRNPNGLHLRPAGLLVQLAAGFQSEIHLTKDNVRVDGRSILDVITLMATQGSEVSVSASGNDAQAAVDAIVEFIESDTTEEEGGRPPDDASSPA